MAESEEILKNSEEETSSENTQKSAENTDNPINAETENLDPKDLEITELKKQIEEQKDKYLRLFADFDNFKKRNAKERLELIQIAGKDVMLALLPILDDFERAIKAAETATDITTVNEGVNLIFNKMLKGLETKGLKPLDSKGTEFNVELHEAITEIPAPTADLQGKVIDEVERGYFLNDKLIRYAKVIVGKKD